VSVVEGCVCVRVCMRGCMCEGVSVCVMCMYVCACVRVCTCESVHRYVCVSVCEAYTCIQCMCVFV